MPLLFELSNEDSILCFVPRGHRKDGVFIDLPGQSANTCAINNAYRLLSMCYTQTDIESREQSLVLNAVNNCQAKIELIIIMQQACDALIKACNIIRTPFDKVKKTIDKLDYEGAKLMLWDAFFSNKDNRINRVLDTILKQHLDAIKVHTIELVPAILSVVFSKVIEASQKAENIRKLQNDYFVGKQLEIMKEFLENPHVYKYMLENEYSIVEEQKYSRQDFISIHRNRLYNIYLDENKFKLMPYAHDSGKPLAIMKKILMKTLEKNGPFTAVGSMGVGFYTADPKPFKTLGSVQLLYFPKGSYSEEASSMGRQHAILVIGIVDDYVVYLDPLCSSTIDGPREAYVMKIETFLQRVDECRIKNGYKTASFYCVDSKRIDTTPELMAEHAIDIASLSTRTSKLKMKG